MLSAKDLKQARAFTRRAAFDVTICIALTAAMKKYIIKCSKVYGYKYASVFARDILLMAMDGLIKPKKNTRFPEVTFNMALNIRATEQIRDKLAEDAKAQGYSLHVRKQISTYCRDVILTALEDCK